MDDGLILKNVVAGESKVKVKTREARTVRGDSTVRNGGGCWSLYPVSLMAKALL